MVDFFALLAVGDVLNDQDLFGLEMLVEGDGRFAVTEGFELSELEEGVEG